MEANNKGHDSSRHLLDFLVDGRRQLVGCVVVVTMLLAAVVPRLDLDVSAKSMYSTTSPAYGKHQEFVNIFGTAEAIVVAINVPGGAGDPKVLSALDAITVALENLDKIARVISLTNVQSLQHRDGEVGNFSVVLRRNGSLVLPDPSTLEQVRKGLPVMDLLLSQDLRTMGVLVVVADQWRKNLQVVEKLLGDIEAIVRSKIPPGAEYGIVGQSIIRLALRKYSLQTAVVFGVLCGLICALVTVYLFRSVKVTLVTGLILALSVFWVLGLMSVLGIPLNPTTSTASGLILITSLEIVIHMVVRFNQFRQFQPDRIEAAKEAVRFLCRPCLICATTTAIGFGSCMVSDVPMVFQLGLIMSVGILISFVLAMILTPALIAATRSFDADTEVGMVGDLLTPLLERTKQSIAKHYRLFTWTGFVISAFMFSGAWFIRTDAQFLRFLGDSSSEVRNVRFVEANLTGFHTLEVVLESGANAFKKAELWRKVSELEERLKHVPGVTSTDSLLPFLRNAHGLLARRASTDDELFSTPGLIPQLLFIMMLSPEAKRMARTYVEDGFGRIRILVRFRNDPSIPVGEVISNVGSVADSVLQGLVNVYVSGELAVYASQAEEFVTSEAKAMAVALGMITILLMIQMGTPLFGLVSLIPNIPPIAAVFGIMGWFGIFLDGATIFAATVAVGLAADNTIHFVAQLKREIRLNPQAGVEECVFHAYSLAARPMAAWSFVTLLGFLAMTATPFRASHNFGILVSAAVFMGIFGDLVFMQSMILTSPFLKKLILRIVQKEIAGQGRTT